MQPNNRQPNFYPAAQGRGLPANPRPQAGNGQPAAAHPQDIGPLAGRPVPSTGVPARDDALRRFGFTVNTELVHRGPDRVRNACARAISVKIKDFIGGSPTLEVGGASRARFQVGQRHVCGPILLGADAFRDRSDAEEYVGACNNLYPDCDAARDGSAMYHWSIDVAYHLTPEAIATGLAGCTSHIGFHGVHFFPEPEGSLFGGEVTYTSVDADTIRCTLADGGRAYQNNAMNWLDEGGCVIGDYALVWDLAYTCGDYRLYQFRLVHGSPLLVPMPRRTRLELAGMTNALQLGSYFTGHVAVYEYVTGQLLLCLEPGFCRYLPKWLRRFTPGVMEPTTLIVSRKAYLAASRQARLLSSRSAMDWRAISNAAHRADPKLSGEQLGWVVFVAYCDTRGCELRAAAADAYSRPLDVEAPAPIDADWYIGGTALLAAGGLVLWRHATRPKRNPWTEPFYLPPGQEPIVSSLLRRVQATSWVVSPRFPQAIHDTVHAVRAAPPLALYACTAAPIVEETVAVGLESAGVPPIAVAIGMGVLDGVTQGRGPGTMVYCSFAHYAFSCAGHWPARVAAHALHNAFVIFGLGKQPTTAPAAWTWRGSLDWWGVAAAVCVGIGGWAFYRSRCRSNKTRSIQKVLDTRQVLLKERTTNPVALASIRDRLLGSFREVSPVSAGITTRFAPSTWIDSADSELASLKYRHCVDQNYDVDALEVFQRQIRNVYSVVRDIEPTPWALWIKRFPKGQRDKIARGRETLHRSGWNPTHGTASMFIKIEKGAFDDTVALAPPRAIQAPSAVAKAACGPFDHSLANHLKAKWTCAHQFFYAAGADPRDVVYFLTQPSDHRWAVMACGDDCVLKITEDDGTITLYHGDFSKMDATHAEDTMETLAQSTADCFNPSPETNWYRQANLDMANAKGISKYGIRYETSGTMMSGRTCTTHGNTCIAGALFFEAGRALEGKEEPDEIVVVFVNRMLMLGYTIEFQMATSQDPLPYCQTLLYAVAPYVWRGKVLDRAPGLLPGRMIARLGWYTGSVELRTPELVQDWNRAVATSIHPIGKFVPVVATLISAMGGRQLGPIRHFKVWAKKIQFDFASDLDFRPHPDKRKGYDLNLLMLCRRYNCEPYDLERLRIWLRVKADTAPAQPHRLPSNFDGLVHKFISKDC